MSEVSNLELKPLVSNWSRFAEQLDFSPTLERDGGLDISGNNPFFANPIGKMFDPKKGPWNSRIALTHSELLGQVHACRDEWRNHVVELLSFVDDPAGGKRNQIPFQENWNQKELSDEKFDAFMAALAVAGERLFYSLFMTDDSKRIGEHLLAATRAKEIVFTVTSDSFFAPWGMLYTHPDGDLNFDGSNWKKEGFWGYKHVFEHNTSYLDIADELCADQNGLLLSMNFDERIDRTLRVTCIEEHLEFFKTCKTISSSQRKLRSEFASAITPGPCLDQILYFFCHGSGAAQGDHLTMGDIRLALSDDMPITPADLAHWFKDQNFKNNPLVFINACQSGQMSSAFYRGFVPELLKRKARCVIGPQIDMPAVFASKYALSFFDLFLGEGAGPKSAGPILRHLNRQFLDEFKNPLGMAYSIFRGIDCRVKKKEV